MTLKRQRHFKIATCLSRSEDILENKLSDKSTIVVGAYFKIPTCIYSCWTGCELQYCIVQRCLTDRCQVGLAILARFWNPRLGSRTLCGGSAAWQKPWNTVNCWAEFFPGKSHTQYTWNWNVELVNTPKSNLVSSQEASFYTWELWMPCMLALLPWDSCPFFGEIIPPEK